MTCNASKLTDWLCVSIPTQHLRSLHVCIFMFSLCLVWNLSMICCYLVYLEVIDDQLVVGKLLGFMHYVPHSQWILWLCSMTFPLLLLGKGVHPLQLGRAQQRPSAAVKWSGTHDAQAVFLPMGDRHFTDKGSLDKILERALIATTGGVQAIKRTWVNLTVSFQYFYNRSQNKCCLWGHSTCVNAIFHNFFPF